MITLLRPAGGDHLTPADYRDIFDELRAGRTLRALVEAAGAPEGRIAYWSRYGRDLAMTPDLQARNELRRLVGLPELLPAAGDILAGAIAPDAAVYLAGPANGPAGRALLINQHAGDVAITWPANGEPSINTRRALSSTRPRRKTVNLTPATHARLLSQARAAGVTVQAFIERLLQHHEEQPHDLD